LIEAQNQADAYAQEKKETSPNTELNSD